MAIEQENKRYSVIFKNSFAENREQKVVLETNSPSEALKTFHSKADVSIYDNVNNEQVADAGWVHSDKDYEWFVEESFKIEADKEAGTSVTHSSDDRLPEPESEEEWALINKARAEVKPRGSNHESVAEYYGAALNEPLASQAEINENEKIGQIADDRFPDQKPVDLSTLLPKKIEEDYIKIGNKFHYGFKPELEAFQDNGSSFETASTGQTVTKDIVEIASARGWAQISIKGSDEFKRQAWLAASEKGIAVKGYKPSNADLASLIKAKGSTADALAPALAKEKEATTPKAAPNVADASSKEKADALRNGDASTTLKRFPELINAYALIKAAELLADKKIQNPDGRVAFVSSVKDTLANQVERGQKIPDVQYKDRSQETDLSQSR